MFHACVQRGDKKFWELNGPLYSICMGLISLELLMGQHLHAPDMAPFLVVLNCFIDIFVSQMCNKLHSGHKTNVSLTNSANQCLLDQLCIKNNHYTTFYYPQHLQSIFHPPNCGRRFAVGVEYLFNTRDSE